MASVVQDIRPAFDADIDQDGTQTSSAQLLYVKNITTPFAQEKRILLRWNLGAIGGGATILNAQLACFVNQATAGALVDIHPLGPNAELKADNYDTTAEFNDILDYGPYDHGRTFMQTTGYKTVDLGSVALADVQSRLDDEDWFNVGIVTVTSGANMSLAASEHVSKEPPLLRVTYTPVAEFRVPRTGGRQPRYKSIGQLANRISLS